MSSASIDRLDFHHPVFVGNLLTLKAGINLVGRSSVLSWRQMMKRGATARPWQGNRFGLPRKKKKKPVSGILRGVSYKIDTHTL